MISGLAVRTPFTSRSAQEHGGIARRLTPLSQIKALNLPYQEPNNLAYHVPKRCSSRLFASLSSELGNTVESISRNKEFSNTNIKREDACVQESYLSNTNMNAFYRFSRPPIIYATIIEVISMAFLPVQTMADLSPVYFSAILKAIVPMVLMTICHSGINQISDIEIDKINKPTLPLASGEISVGIATTITCISAISCFIMSVLNSPPLLYGNLMEFLLAIAYSADLPFLRWKRNIFLTSICIVGIRALIHPLCSFVHFQKYVLGRPMIYTKPILFTVVFMTLVCITVSILKDVPDVEGDKACGLRSPSIIFGVEKVFWSCVYTFMVLYCGAAIFGATLTSPLNKFITILGHGILAAILWTRAKSVDTSEPSATLSFYLFIMKLIYAEYLLIIFVR